MLDLAGRDVEGEGPGGRLGKSFQRLVSGLRIKAINHSVHVVLSRSSLPELPEISEAVFHVLYSILCLMQCDY